MTLTDKVNDLFTKALDQWLHNKACGTCMIPPPLVDKCMILVVIHRIFGSKPNTNVTIICETFAVRGELIDFLTNNAFDEDSSLIKQLIVNKNIKVLTADFVEDRRVRWSGDVCILYNVQKIGSCVWSCFQSSPYKLAVYKSVIKDTAMASNIYRFAPIIEAFGNISAQNVKESTPVEEMWVGSRIEEDSKEQRLYDYYTQYIETSIAIFGDLKTLEYARKGNPDANISATEICNNIALNNGWHDRLDMSYEYNVKLDEMYNPNALADRAEETYRKIRDRRKLVAEYSGKLDEILNIVNENLDKKILIINRSGDFANVVTSYINEHSEYNICANYHDNVLPIPKMGPYGVPMTYKSGVKKGQIIELHAKAQQSLAVKQFNDGGINILSTSNAPNVNLDVDIDVIIITSPLCSSIKTFLYRLSKVNYPKEKIKLYSLVLLGTIEEKALRNKELALNHTILNKSEFDENTCTTFIVN